MDAESGNPMERAWCDECGCGLWIRSPKRKPGMTNLKAGMEELISSPGRLCLHLDDATPPCTRVSTNLYNFHRSFQPRRDTESDHGELAEESRALGNSCHWNETDCIEQLIKVLIYLTALPLQTTLS